MKWVFHTVWKEIQIVFSPEAWISHLMNTDKMKETKTSERSLVLRRRILWAVLSNKVFKTYVSNVQSCCQPSLNEMIFSPPLSISPEVFLKIWCEKIATTFSKEIRIDFTKCCRNLPRLVKFNEVALNDLSKEYQSEGPSNQMSSIKDDII